MIDSLRAHTALGFERERSTPSIPSLQLPSALSAVLSLEGWLLAFAVSGLYKSLPLLKSSPVDLTVLTGAMTVLAASWILVSRRVQWTVWQLASISAVLLWLGYAALSVSWSHPTGVGFARIARGLPLVVVVFLVAGLVVGGSEQRLRRLLGLVPLIGVVGFLSTFAEAANVVTPKDGANAANYIVRGLAMTVALMTALPKAMVRGRSGWVRAAWACFSALMLAGVLVAGSRQALIAAAIGLLVPATYVIRVQGLRGALAMLAALGAALGVGVSVLSSQGISLRAIDRLSANLDRLGGGRSLIERAAYLEAAGEVFARRPVAGAGLGSFGVLAGADPFAYPHNIVAEVGAEGGAIGLVLFALAVSCVAAAYLRARRSLDAGVRLALDSVAVVVGVNVLVSSSYTEHRLLFMVLGLLAGASGLHGIRPSHPLSVTSDE